MHLPLVVLAVLATQGSGPAPDATSDRTYDGRAGELRVMVPRIEATATVDGVLDEPVWLHAARLTGFSQYQPVDGRAADESTEVLVWYAPDAIWFGIRARESHGTVVRATRANRDNITSEDHIQILLDTYNDRRYAFVFGVNALGVQQDGTRGDQSGGGAGGRSATGGGMRDMNPLDGNVDLNPDFVFESRGRLTDSGYEVEIRIPFKSLRYQDARVQDWGIHILRRAQHSGAQDSWVPAQRGNASFLAQAGTLAGLHDLQRGLVLEAAPAATARADGSQHSSGWRYSSGTTIGGDVRWGIRQNLTLNATISPDFSQVEADVGQVTLNERFSLFYPEKRPFFLDGLELFDTPNQLIYTRRIVAPDAGLKLAGKALNTNLAVLLASDGGSYSWGDRNHPLISAARLRRDVAQNVTLGTVLTSREDGGDYSRLIGADLRVVHSKLYYAQLQAVRSFTDSAGRAMNGSLVEAVWDRTGRAWGFHYSARATAPEFRAAAGFVNRTGVAEGSIFNRLTWYGAPNSRVQTTGAFFGFSRLRDYRRVRDGSIEGSESFSPSATLRGGWRLNGSVARNFYSYVPVQYSGYSVDVGGAQEPFHVPAMEGNLFSGSAGLTTPTFRRATGTVSAALGDAALFQEASRGRSLRTDATLDMRPTAALRTTVQLTRLTLTRAHDGSRYSREVIPRAKIEYQLSRAMFVRAIGQYTSRNRSPLLDRDGNPILINGTLTAAESINEFQLDWLFSYRPSPGTVFYLGYGTTMREPEDFRFDGLRRRADGFFTKLSYAFRM